MIEEVVELERETRVLYSTSCKRFAILAYPKSKPRILRPETSCQLLASQGMNDY